MAIGVTLPTEVLATILTFYNFISTSEFIDCNGIAREQSNRDYFVFENDVMVFTFFVTGIHRPRFPPPTCAECNGKNTSRVTD